MRSFFPFEARRRPPCSPFFFPLRRKPFFLSRPRVSYYALLPGCETINFSTLSVSASGVLSPFFVPSLAPPPRHSETLRFDNEVFRPRAQAFSLTLGEHPPSPPPLSRELSGLRVPLWTPSLHAAPEVTFFPGQPPHDRFPSFPPPCGVGAIFLRVRDAGGGVFRHFSHDPARRNTSM